MAKNVFGEELDLCSNKPLTGFFRDGCCNTGDEDLGLHLVCALVTDDFLRFSKDAGNDLSTPRPEYNFSGLKHGDKWCLCVSRWIEAWKAGKAPFIIPEATHEKTLEFIPMELLLSFAWRNQE